MAAAERTRAVPRRRSIRIIASKTKDAEFLALLRRKCLHAASVGALTAAGESIPGLGRVLGFVFGELLDAQFLARIQRELIEETIALYKVDLAPPVRDALIGRVQVLGTSASIAGDAVMRRLIQRSLTGIGGVVARRVMPLATIASSAFSNAAVTYAIGKRAQAVAQLQGAPLDAVPDALRAFSGVDERRVFDWTAEAVKSSVGRITDAVRGMASRKADAGAKPRSRARSSRKKREGGGR
jgi:uncharacterized protein (DUF697 family)